MSQQGLAIHTTTGELGIALVNRQGVFRLQTWDLGRQLANEIQLKLAEFMDSLSWQELDFLAVAKGPGSFTSTRIGVVTAKTLAQQLQLPVYGISTLEAIAWTGQKELNKNQYIAVEMKAHNEDIFGAIYQHQGKNQPFQVIISEARFNSEQWQNLLSNYSQNNQSLVTLSAPDNIAFTSTHLLEISLILNQDKNITEKYNWQSLDAFYE